MRCGDTALQFDAGRGTVLRLVEAGCALHELGAVFLTHVHSDHVVDLADVVMTRWLQGTLHPRGPLPIVAVDGLATTFAATDAGRLRRRHRGPRRPRPARTRRSSTSARSPCRPSRPSSGTTATITVEAVAVHHEPVREAVAYRVTTPDGVVVVSGDTRVCDEVADLAGGADVLVHEACRASALRDVVRGSAFEHIFEYHADTVSLGALAAGAEVGHLVLTHLIPPPTTVEAEAEFAADVRQRRLHRAAHRRPRSRPPSS